MASNQVPRHHESVLDELVKQEQTDVVPMVIISDSRQQELALVGNLKNVTSRPMNLHAEKIWSGRILYKYQDVIPSGATIGFSVLANIQDGVKSAVVYRGRNNSGQNQCGWLVAWSNPRDLRSKKVYVDCGAIEKYNNINWANIERELNNSSGDSSHRDASTGTSVHARVLAMVNPLISPSDGTIVATFN